MVGSAQVVIDDIRAAAGECIAKAINRLILLRAVYGNIAVAVGCRAEADGCILLLQQHTFITFGKPESHIGSGCRRCSWYGINRWRWCFGYAAFAFAAGFRTENSTNK